MIQLTFIQQDMDFVLEVMQEISDAMELCAREQYLYQAPKLKDLVEQLYVEVIESTMILSKTCQEITKKRIFDPYRQKEKLKEATARIRRISEAVVREVEYQHRLEMLRTSNRIVEMQVEQRRMVGMLEDQKRILAGMEEERRVMGVIQGQQEILHVVQEIQRRLQTEADGK